MTPPVDLLYILGTGSLWQDNELRYSLRSVARHIPVSRVLIVGTCPAWVDNIEHIPADDIDTHRPAINAQHKLRVALASGQVERPFLLMNDDFFILQDRQEIPIGHKGLLRRSLKPGMGAVGHYRLALQHTLSGLLALGHGMPLDYGLHTPLLLEPDWLQQSLAELAHRNILLRTWYGNRWEIGGEPMADVKLRLHWKPPRLKQSFLSVDEPVVQDPAFRHWIHARFPDPSPFERS